MITSDGPMIPDVNQKTQFPSKELKVCCANCATYWKQVRDAGPKRSKAAESRNDPQSPEDVGAQRKTRGRPCFSAPKSLHSATSFVAAHAPLATYHLANSKRLTQN